jgi:hypothetical protein
MNAGSKGYDHFTHRSIPPFFYSALRLFHPVLTPSPYHNFSWNLGFVLTLSP